MATKDEHEETAALRREHRAIALDLLDVYERISHHMDSSDWRLRADLDELERGLRLLVSP